MHSSSSFIINTNFLFDLYAILQQETDQLEYIIPEETSLEHQLQVSDSGFVEFVRYLLETNPKRRPTARQALEHSWLSQSYAVNSFRDFH